MPAKSLSEVPAEHVRRRLVRFHVPDRAACRYRPRHHPHQGRAAGRWLLQGQWYQDLHHGWRARPDRQHHPSGTGQAAGCAGQFARHLLFLVPKVLVNDDGSLGERNSLSCGSIEHKMGIQASATCVMNFDGATGWMVGEQQGSGGDVHHDELRASGRRYPGLGHWRAFLPERHRVRSRAHPEPCPDWPGGAGQGGRSHHRASRCAAHAADHEGLERRWACVFQLRRAAARYRQVQR